MLIRLVNRCVLIGALFIFGGGSIAETTGVQSSVDNISMLAGKVPANGLPAQFDRAVWDRYAKAVQSNWRQYQDKIGRPMTAWVSSEIPAFKDTVFYPFSGPDFATFDQVYPGARRYVMVAMQRAERPVDLATLSPQAAHQTLEVLTDAWRHYGSDGFFVTEYLDKYLTQNKVRIGASTFLTTFFQLKGFQIKSVRPIRVNNAGEIEELPTDSKDWLSVRFQLERAGSPVTVDYVRMDLSNKGLEQHSEHVTFLRKVSASPVLLKAASHLPQNRSFSTVSDTLLAYAPFILQDETGLKYTKLASGFETKLYGRFERAHDAFPSYHKDLAQAFAERKDVRPLGFRFGYFKEGNYALIVARRNSSK